MKTRFHRHFFINFLYIFNEFALLLKIPLIFELLCGIIIKLSKKENK